MTTAYTYILQCANGQYYVGSTTDLDKRLQEHQAGLGAKFTSKHLPVKLVYKEEYSSIEMAFSRERQLHGWSRAKKEALIKGEYDRLSSLASSAPAVPVLRQAQEPHDVEGSPSCIDRHFDKFSVRLKKRPAIIIQGNKQS